MDGGKRRACTMRVLFRVLLPVVASAVFASGNPAFAGEKSPPKPDTREKCAVCGMFVAPYPAFVSAVRFKGGAYAYFDGPKDLFRFTIEPGRYDPKKKPEDIEAVFVKDYYTLESIDGRAAFYVAGSNVSGPMGHELIPFRTEKDARHFMKDHAGKSLYRFREVTKKVLDGLK